MFWLVMTSSGFLGLAISFTSMWFLHQTGATTYRTAHSIIMLLIYVDDIVLTGNDPKHICIEFAGSAKGIAISQRMYLINLPDETSTLLGTKLVSSLLSGIIVFGLLLHHPDVAIRVRGYRSPTSSGFKASGGSTDLNHWWNVLNKSELLLNIRRKIKGSMG
ncbi:hypothetical protein NE237_017190 [Protea cynaroides]|uniref:Reverse transcriptase Ty1/copia-type domain-containing protein n=1 Tax=Protea cynaroides TaxID=273540 RepID=A0A9Q0K7M0_9MAGN|nr:hypothetical protein NE237_017190 [Protea cynaroides]